MPSGSKKRKHKQMKQRPIEHVAPLYVEDIGTQGIKTPRMGSQMDATFRVKVDKHEKSKRKSRMERFGQQNEKLRKDEPDVLNSALRSSRTSQDKISNSSHGKFAHNNTKFVGTNKHLEKSYMRLTTYPKADDVRPLKVLKKSLAHIKNKFIQEEDFEWANEQLKSVRQDITVQHLRCPFVLEVYETHARILLEHGDLNEFNQCQTMIRSLTHPQYSLEDEDIGNTNNSKEENSIKPLQQVEEAADEFQAYRLLYAVVHQTWSDLSLALSEHSTYREYTEYHCCAKNGEYHSGLPIVARGSSARHALNVVKAVMHNDYQTFFRLYESAPHLSAYLMDFLVRRVRNSAFERIIAAFRPTVSVEHFREALVFQDLEETRRFLKKSGALFVNEKKNDPAFWVDCKATFATL
ncbi:MAG: hypothetical protein SGILL_001103 [Bacillariaceae sp.]